MTTLKTFLIEQQALVEDLERESAANYWDAALTGTEEANSRAAETGAKVAVQYADPARFEQLKAIGDSAESDDNRAKKLLIDSFTRNQMPESVIRELSERGMEIESLFSNFRATLGDQIVTDNDLKQVLRESGDVTQRQAAWAAGKLIGVEAAPKVLELVALRNREAQRLGFANYYAMEISLQELDVDNLFTLLESVSEQLTPAFDKYKADLDARLAVRYNTTASELMPWHYGDPFFQEAPIEPGSIDSYFENLDLEQAAIRFFAEIGLPIDRLIQLADLFEKPGKSQHAFCTSIGRGTGDVRVLCNLRRNSRWMETLLHEFGHAVYDERLDPSLPFFLKTTAHTMTTEAIAQIMGRFATNAAWLKRYAGIPAADAARIEIASRDAGRAHLLIFTQWVQVMTHFERELYADPTQDLNTLWWDLVERYQHLKRPPGRNAPDWAAKIHLAAAPVYYHNYLLGEMTASQILASLRELVAPGGDDALVSSPLVGKWLTERIFQPGARYSWNDLLTRATGQPLNAAYMAADIG